MPVLAEQAEAVGAEIGAIAYVECSSLMQDGVRNLF